MLRSVTVRFLAALILLIAGAGVYACDISDACVFPGSGSGGGCDQPSGDNCLCCCQHVVPVSIFALERGDIVFREPVHEPLASLLSLPLLIDHPPQL